MTPSLAAAAIAIIFVAATVLAVRAVPAPPQSALLAVFDGPFLHGLARLENPRAYQRFRLGVFLHALSATGTDVAAGYLAGHTPLTQLLSATLYFAFYLVSGAMLILVVLSWLPPDAKKPRPARRPPGLP